jgi:hypothetical protein
MEDSRTAKTSLSNTISMPYVSIGIGFHGDQGNLWSSLGTGVRRIVMSITAGSNLDRTLWAYVKQPNQHMRCIFKKT